MKLEVARPVGLILIAVAAFLILVPILNVGFQTLPWQPQSGNWRFGTIGFLLGAMTFPILGLGLLGVGGVVRESRGLVRLASILAAVFLAVVIIGLAVFLLEATKLRGVGADPRMLTALTIELRRTLLISGVAIPALAALTFGSYNLLKGMKVEAEVMKGSGPLIRAGGQ